MPVPAVEGARVKGFPFRPDDLAGLYSRVLKIRPSRGDASAAESWGRMALSGQAKRRKILEEARTAVLDRIRHTR